MLAGFTHEQELTRLLECTRFIRQINEHLKFDARVLCIAIHIFCTFARKYSFAEFNQYVACGVAHFIAAKCEYKHPTIEFYIRFAHDNKPPPKAAKVKVQKPPLFEEVKD